MIDENDEIYLTLTELSQRSRSLNKDTSQIRPICLLLKKLLIDNPSLMNQRFNDYGIKLAFIDPVVEKMKRQLSFLRAIDSRRVSLVEFLDIKIIPEYSLTIRNVIEITECMFDGVRFIRPTHTTININELALNKIENDSLVIFSKLSLIVSLVLDGINPLLNRLSDAIMENAADIKLDPGSYCPCQSKKLAVDCCYTETGWNKFPKQIKPSNFNFSNSKCYASSLNSCSTKPSNEDYMTLSVLKHIAQVDNSNQVKSWGHSWRNSKSPISLSYKSFKAKILCTYHNNALSVLDAEALRFFESITTIENDFKLNQLGQNFFLFSGEDIERWMLKAIIGSFLVNNTISTVDPIWLQILFCNKPMPKGWGMYFINANGYVNSIALSPLLDKRTNAVIGAEVFVHNFKFVLALTDLPYPDEKTFRPNRLKILRNGIKKIIEFSWTERKDNNDVSLIETKHNLRIKPEWDQFH